jgi:hypothetical protein
LKSLIAIASSYMNSTLLDIQGYCGTEPVTSLDTKLGDVGDLFPGL